MLRIMSPVTQRLTYCERPHRGPAAGASFTCLALVPAPPEQVWGLVAEPSLTWPAWLTSVTAVKEICRSTAPSTPHLTSSEVVQSSAMSLCGRQFNVSVYFYGCTSSRAALKTYNSRGKLLLIHRPNSPPCMRSLINQDMVNNAICSLSRRRWTCTLT
jgi:hypothetical protein